MRVRGISEDDFNKRYPAALLRDIYRDAAAGYFDHEPWGDYSPYVTSAIFAATKDNWYAGALLAEKKFGELYDGCVAENDDHAILMLLFASEFYDGES